MRKRIFFTLCVLVVGTIAYAQRTIQMEYDNGVYRLPCTVNGANMKMIFDTGASTVCLSLATAIHLYQNGFIKSSDFRGAGQSSTASGDIVNNMIVNLRDIEIGGMHLYNVECVVMESLNAPLLLGQTAIQKLGSITIKGNQLTVNNGYYSGSKNNYFNYNGCKIDCEAFIQALQMNYTDFYANFSNKERSRIAIEVNTIIGFIRKGECNFELNSMHFTNNYPNIKRSKKEYSYVGEAVYYINEIAKGFIKRGEYIR